ncbi:ABC transporter ATP-binding protein [Corynebacterium durum]
MTEVLATKNLSKTYRDGTQAVRGVDLAVNSGECLGLVGESGSGKSTLSRCLLGLESLHSGQMWLQGEELTALPSRVQRKKRRTMQMVFQNPSSSFNNRLRVGDSLLEPLACFPEKRNAILERKGLTLQQYAEELMGLVQLDPGLLQRYPGQLSGGQKQRIAIARSLSTEPAVIILDEPTASLDVSVQARVLNLLKDLQEQLNLSYLFISHDLTAVRFMSDRMVVMRKGELVDECGKDELFADDRDDYTKQLVSLFEV